LWDVVVVVVVVVVVKVLKDHRSRSGIRMG
jgi:hypothetical protein